MGNHPFLGAHYQNGQTTFSVKSEYAEKIELCLFSPDEKEETRIQLQKGEGNIWSVTLPEIKSGQKYGYRAHGEYNPSRGLFLIRRNLLSTLIVWKFPKPWTTGRPNAC